MLTQKTNSSEDNNILNQFHLEGYKQEYDYHKHLTTVSTGVIVLVGVFFGNILEQTRCNFLAGVMFLFLISAIWFSCQTMLSISGLLSNKKMGLETNSYRFKNFGTMLFFLGLIALASFCILNFFCPIN